MKGKIAFFIIIFYCTASCSIIKQTTANNAENKFNPLSLLIRFYQGPLNHLNSVKRYSCPMHPSCSTYSKQAIKKHGGMIGWIMTCDRLLRCGRDELKFCTWIKTNDTFKCYDPVENNDFWWYKKIK